MVIPEIQVKTIVIQEVQARMMVIQEFQVRMMVNREVQYRKITILATQLIIRDIQAPQERIKVDTLVI